MSEEEASKVEIGKAIADVNTLFKGVKKSRRPLYQQLLDRLLAFLGKLQPPQQPQPPPLPPKK